MDQNATFDIDAPTCPCFTLSREDMEKQNFLGFVQQTFREQPELAMFKIKPPSDWNPTQRRLNLDDMIIQTPIKQLAFGKTGSYKCVLVEDKACTAAEYQTLAESEERLPPLKCRKDYRMLERHFWKSVTMNPPLYGADTPMSLFSSDHQGWALSHLADLLKQKGVPEIPGVTTPMTYFGMWKSFFAWHVEDADLYSVNFLHWGAPKVWYGISPKNKAKFERLASGMNPEANRTCKGFLRHKDTLISPSILRQFNVPYHMCKQEKGEYVVLNAAAYHSGFNCGFNTAEAVNFATEDWVEAGRKAIPCTCDILKDQVCIDMSLFCSESGELSVDSASVTHAESSTASEEVGAGEEAASPSQTSDVSELDTAPGTCKRPASHTPSRTPAAKAQRGSRGAARSTSVPPPPQPPPPRRTSTTSQAAAKPLRSAAMKLSAARKQCSKNGDVMQQLAALAKPAAIVYSGAPGEGNRGFDLVVPLDKPASSKKKVMLQYLREGRDGLYRPCRQVFEESLSSVVPIRTQILDPGARKPGFKLLTLRSRILGTELV